ncbi:polyprenyl synthetase family protein [Pediococcus claussenii]|nr:farnesyl diphosphate synthase [Pediococcus claussenii]
MTMNSKDKIFDLKMLNHFMDQKIESDSLNNDLRTMMRYSLEAGGKRIRPALFLAVVRSLGGTINTSTYTTAMALEVLHTYSLIHDDLPAMDNDDLRRGKLTSHKKFGEAQAILTGDALLTYTFQLLTDTDFDGKQIKELVHLFATAAGADGMIAGQLEDILGNNIQYSLSELKQLHLNKTGRLISLAVETGIVVSNSNISEELRSWYKEFGRNFGLAFQIFDDILDVTKTSKELGKTANKDVSLNKNTYVSILGLDGAKKELNRVIQQCQYAITQIRERIDFETDSLEVFLSDFKIDGEIK